MKPAAALFAVVWVLCASQAIAQERIDDRIPTRFVENGKPVTLEVVIFKPPGAGPFPALMFNHGSTGRGNDPSLFTRTWTSDAITRFFLEHGWLVAYPQRRGRGKSDGTYNEGFEPGRWGYSCLPQYALAGLEHAKQDLDAALEYLKARSDVDAKRMLIGGQSRGGILSVAYAGARPESFIGAVNFVGGWMSDRCADPEAINTATFRRAGGYPHPTLWLYGENAIRITRSSTAARTSAHLPARGARGRSRPMRCRTGRTGIW